LASIVDASPRRDEDRMTDTDCLIVLTTLPVSADAAAFATALVAEHLAACVNVHGEMESVYRWKDAIEHDRERQIVIKTTRDRLDALRARIGALHPYDLPEFLVLELSGGSAEYLAWVADCTRP
jgi:periplasmic divalent cation tolerance protein